LNFSEKNGIIILLKEGANSMKEFPQIPGYKILQKLGHGGMADVYLGVQENLARKVAIKVLIPSLFRDEQFSARFIKEAQTAAQLVHPNIITIHDVGTEGDVFYIVMEYLEESLKQRLKRQTVLAPGDALHIVKMIASALDYAHSRGFIHRDIKPDNIMFRSDGTVVLVDFGIARAIDSSTQLTRTGTSIGTPHYMSPEQCRGEKIDGRSDIYSLGIQLYEILTGEVPYKAENTTGIIIKQIQEPIPRLPAELAHFQPLIDKMVAKNKRERIQSGKEAIRFIDAYLTAESEELMPTRPITRQKTEIMEEATVVTPQPSEAITKQDTAPKKKWLLPTLLSVLFICLVALIYFLTLSPKDNGNVKVEKTGTGEQEKSKPVGSQPEKQTDVQAAQEKPEPEKTTAKISSPGTQTVKSIPPKKEPEPAKIEKEPVKKAEQEKTGEQDPLKDQAERDRQFNNYMQQIRDHMERGDTEKALESLAKARELKDSPRLQMLERGIHRAQQKKRLQMQNPGGVKSTNILGLHPDIRKTYNSRLQRIQIDIPNIAARFRVKGFITMGMSIDEKGMIRVRLLDDNLTVFPPDRINRVKRLIRQKIDGISLTPPKGKTGEPVRVENWRVTFKVGKYMNRINLVKK
jgi:serine/threonine protein kinase